MGLAGLAGVARILSVAVDKVTSGRGLETYRTVWLVEFNYISILVLFGALSSRLSSAELFGCMIGGSGGA